VTGPGSPAGPAGPAAAGRFDGPERAGNDSPKGAREINLSTAGTIADEGAGDETRTAPSRPARVAHAVALGGLILFGFVAPGSIAAAWIAISVAVCGWIVRAIVTRRADFRRSALDLPLWLLFAWTALSAIFSAEPAVSLVRLPSAATFLFFYFAQSIPRTRREVGLVAFAVIAGASACTLWGVGELARGRGVVIEGIADDSPLRGAVELQAGDCVWMVNDRRVRSVAEIDEAIRKLPVGERLRLAVIARGEHVERKGPPVTESLKSAASPSRIVGTRPTHRFRASGWTRHYVTFAETAQLAAQLALGLALALWRRGEPAGTRRAAPSGSRRRTLLFLAAFALLACGVALTAMRTALVSLAVGALVVAWRATGSAGAGAEAATPTETATAGDADTTDEAGTTTRPKAEAARAETRTAAVQAEAGRRAVRARRTVVWARVAVAGVVACALVLGAFAVWRTRAEGAMLLRDDSSRLRLAIARAALARVLVRPLVGHGVDAVHRHWREWGFPGDDVVHTHSTPLQLAFERGLPALLFWLWLLAAFWLTLSRAERSLRVSPDAATHGIMLGAAGAFAGFCASSLVNYNFGDAEVALLLWWLMGATVKVVSSKQ
jgi:hypothetical protein